MVIKPFQADSQCRLALWLLVIGFLIGNVGCITKSSFPYSPQGNITPLFSTGGGLKIYISPLEDRHKEAGRTFGPFPVRHGFVADRPIPEVFKLGLTKEFQYLGIEVVNNQSESQIYLKGVIKRFDFDHGPDVATTELDLEMYETGSNRFLWGGNLLDEVYWKGSSRGQRVGKSFSNAISQLHKNQVFAQKLVEVSRVFPSGRPQPPPKQKGEGAITGSGFLFGSSNFVITNFHVIKGAKSIWIKLLNGEKIKAEVVAKDKSNDIAFLKLNEIPDLFVGSINLGDSSKMRIGDKVFTIGYPISNILGQSPKYSEGVINSLSGVDGDPKVFQISVPIQPGNSGGPLFNERGEVIGITVASLDAVGTLKITGNIPQNVNFAIKSAFIHNMLPMLPETLISPTGLVPVPLDADNTRAGFVERVKNNIVLIEARN